MLADYPIIFPLNESQKRFAVSSGFGIRMHPVKKKRILHAGVDIAAPYGTAVYASGNGKVVQARYSSSYGWYVEILHSGGFSTRYAHLSKLHVRKGNDVRMGRHIGNVGHTGVATGNHLHFELRKNGKPQNPLQWVILRDSRSKKNH